MPNIENRPDPPAASRTFTRRRVIAGTVGLVAVLAVAGFGFGVFEHNPSAPIRINFLGPSQARAEVASEATFSLSNTTSKSGFVSLKAYYNEGFASFRYSSPTDDSVIVESSSHPNAHDIGLPSHTAMTVSFHLPQDGRLGHLELKYVEQRRELPDFLDNLRDLCDSLGAGRRRQVWVQSEEEIQCPWVRPDGTVEPARVVPIGEQPSR